MHLLKNLIVADTESADNGEQRDLLIENGIITAIGPALKAPAEATVIDLKGQYVSPGFIDIGPYLGDPGHEEREDIDSLAAAAVRGGYTAVAPLPNAEPVRHDKSGVNYLVNHSGRLPVTLLPLGAVSRDAAGSDITEMIDMQRAGAVAFTDGLRPIKTAGMLSRALHYVKNFGGTVINQPLDTSLSPAGQLHEGTVSTRLGMPGFPSLAETMMVDRDIALLAYADSRLMLHLLSSGASLSAIKSAKERGLRLFTSVSAHHLQFTVEDVADFSVNLKVLPPLREEADRLALLGGLLDGTIDCVVSNHIALQPENKDLEFFYSDFGALGLESCFAQVATLLYGEISPDRLAHLFSHGPRRALDLEPQRIAEGEIAELSCFQLDELWTLTLADIASKGANSPVIGHTFKGGPTGIFSRNRWIPSY